MFILLYYYTLVYAVVSEMHGHTNVKYLLTVHNSAIIGIRESKLFNSILIDKQLQIGVLARYNGSQQITYWMNVSNRIIFSRLHS
jgi:hypothetical protein